jgi:hypothetical protein
MGISKPGGLNAVPERQLCPVCGKASYSRSGVHPQCEITKADSAFRVALKARIAAGEVQSERRTWAIRCPRCGFTQPCRLFVCNCGQALAVVSGPRAPLAATPQISEHPGPKEK